MNEAIAILKAAIVGFERASLQLLERHLSDQQLHSNLQKVVHGCRCACTSNLKWRYVNINPS